LGIGRGSGDDRAAAILERDGHVRGPHINSRREDAVAVAVAEHITADAGGGAANKAVLGAAGVVAAIIDRRPGALDGEGVGAGAANDVVFIGDRGRGIAGVLGGRCAS